MELDWRGKVMLSKLAEGLTNRESASAAGISRQAMLKRQNVSPEFAEAVTAAREVSEKGEKVGNFIAV